MPINELEQHPYLDYHLRFKERISSEDYYRGIVIGSFPIYAITNTIENEIIVAERFVENQAMMRFFYGSKKSNLWKLLGLSLENKDPRQGPEGEWLDAELAKENCEELLFRNKLLMSDALKRTNRIQESSDDSSLMQWTNNDYINGNRSLNTDLIPLLQANKGIKSIYFTSTSLSGRSPAGWFATLLGKSIHLGPVYNVGLRVWSIACTIQFGSDDFRKYTMYFLPTPKSRGIHWTDRNRLLMFKNYVESKFPEFYEEINHIPVGQYSIHQKHFLSNLRQQFLVESYRQAISMESQFFDGITT